MNSTQIEQALYHLIWQGSHVHRTLHRLEGKIDALMAGGANGMPALDALGARIDNEADKLKNAADAAGK